MKDSKKLSIDSITCPSCGETIPVTETLRRQITEEARAEMQQEISKTQKTLASKEKQLQAREAELSRAEEDIEAEVSKRLADEQAKLVKKATAKGREESRLEIESLQRESAEKDRKLLETQKKELELRKEKRELETAKLSLELEVTRRVDTERERVRTEALSQAAEQHRLKDAEKDKKLADALRMNEDLTRKLQQGSQQTQGEVLELELEDLLRDGCRWDEILPVPKGVRGADVLHEVRSKSGAHCGRIIWEAKHTKNWNDQWIAKLKDDQQQAKADIAVLVTDVLPDDIDCFGLRDGVWVTAPRYVPALVAALRDGVEQVAKAKRFVAGKNETADSIFTYLTGPEFPHRVEAIMRAFISMREDLEEEKRVTARRWGRREKQIDLVVGNTSGMYGDLQGLMGTSLKPIASLEAGDSELEDGEEGLAIAAEAES